MSEVRVDCLVCVENTRSCCAVDIHSIRPKRKAMDKEDWLKEATARLPKKSDRFPHMALEPALVCDGRLEVSVHT